VIPEAPVLVLAAALLVWPSAAGLATRRARALMVGGRPRFALRLRLPRRLPVLAAGLAVAALLGGGLIGLLGGTVVAICADRAMGKDADERRAARVAAQALEEDLPGACDLLAVCLTAGVPVGAALAGVGVAMPGPVGAELSAVAALLRLGAEPRTAWQGAPSELAPLGRVLIRAGESGSTVTAALRELAAEGRSAARARTETAVRRAGVWVLAPLGLCFLPAFLCLGVVPLVLGIAGNVFR
jgi:Flp pilus assembly protein TadB